jgi:energy-coupling factor transport system permease protein
MEGKMEAELYLDYNTILHRRDARTKILAFLIIFIGVVQFEHPLWLIPTLTIVFTFLLVSRSIKNLLRIWFVLLVLAISSLIIWNIFSVGETQLFWFIQYESLLFSLNRMVLIFSLITMGVVLISTTRNEELVMGMIKMGLPYRVGFAISTSLRLVPTIVSSLLTISQAQRSRGLDLESGSIPQRVKKFLPVLVPVFISTIRSTNIFGMALESRGFGARKDRTYYLQMGYTLADYVILFLLIVYLVVSIVLNLSGYGDIQGLTRF